MKYLIVLGINNFSFNYLLIKVINFQFGVFMFPIKSNTSHGRHAKMLCPLNWTWSAVKSSRMVAVMLVKHSRRMQSMLYSYVLTYGPYGVQCQSGIMARLGRAPLLLISLIVFLQVIRTRTCLRRWSGRCGIGAITYDWVNLHYLSIR